MYSFGPETAEMKPDSARAGTTVKTESDRSIGIGLPRFIGFPSVGNVKNRSFSAQLVFVVEVDRACGGRVLKFFPADSRGVISN